MPAAPAPPSYRERLSLEGGTLAAFGLAGSAALLALADDATRLPGSTIGQLVLVAVLLAVLAPRGLKRSIAEAEPLDGPAAAGSGEPTPLWQLPLIVAGLSLPLALAGAPDAALRVTGGCVLVGLAQAVGLATLVARAERAEGRVYVRRPGSRILKGTKLGWYPGGAGARS